MHISISKYLYQVWYHFSQPISCFSFSLSRIRLNNYTTVLFIIVEGTDKSPHETLGGKQNDNITNWFLLVNIGLFDDYLYP